MQIWLLKQRFRTYVTALQHMLTSGMKWRKSMSWIISNTSLRWWDHFRPFCFQVNLSLISTCFFSCLHLHMCFIAIGYLRRRIVSMATFLLRALRTICHCGSRCSKRCLYHMIWYAPHIYATWVITNWNLIFTDLFGCAGWGLPWSRAQASWSGMQL